MARKIFLNNDVPTTRTSIPSANHENPLQGSMPGCQGPLTGPPWEALSVRPIWYLVIHNRGGVDKGCIGRGGGSPPPPPGRPAYAQPLSPGRQVPASMAFVTDSNRSQPLWQPPPTACLTASGAASEVPPLLMHPWGRPPPPPRSTPGGLHTGCCCVGLPEADCKL